MTKYAQQQVGSRFRMTFKMAAGVNLQLNGSGNLSPILQDVDGQVAQILAGIESVAKGVIIESLVDEVDSDVVLETRILLFRLAQGRYDEQLDQASITEQAKLCLKTRKGAKASGANATDVCELFLYAAEITSIFPRDVLSCSSKYVDIQGSPPPGRETDRCEHIKDITELYKKLADLASASRTVREELALVQKERRAEHAENQRTFSALKAEIEELKKADLHTGECRPTQNLVTVVQCDVSTGARTGGNSRANSSNDAEPQSILPEKAESMSRDHDVTDSLACSAGGPSQHNSSAAEPSSADNSATDHRAEQQPGVEQHTVTAKTQQVNDRIAAGATTPHTPHASSATSSSADPAGINGKQEDSQPGHPDVIAFSYTDNTNEDLDRYSIADCVQKQPDNRVNHNSDITLAYSEVSSTEFPPLPPHTTDNRYSDALKKDPCTKPKQHTTRRNSELGAASNTPNSPKSLKGYIPEKITDLYLENVRRDDGDSDQAITQAVKRHANRHGVIVRSVRIVKNRFCDNMVGCRIQVPVYDVQRALNNSNWPPKVKCRKWERRPRKTEARAAGAPRVYDRGGDRQDRQDRPPGIASSRQPATEDRTRNTGVVSVQEPNGDTPDYWWNRGDYH